MPQFCGPKDNVSTSPGKNKIVYKMQQGESHILDLSDSAKLGCCKNLIPLV